MKIITAAVALLVGVLADQTIERKVAQVVETDSSRQATASANRAMSLQEVEEVLAGIADSYSYHFKGPHVREQLRQLTDGVNIEWLVANLEQIVKKTSRPAKREPSKQGGDPVVLSGEPEVEQPRTHDAALIWLGIIGTEQAEALIVSELQKSLPEDVTKDDHTSFAIAAYSLGQCGSDGSLALLREMMTESYWLERGTRSVSSSLNLDEEHMRLALRQLAFTAFCESGTEQALQQLELGEGFPEYFVQQLPSAIEVCYERLFGVPRTGKSNKVQRIP